MKKVLTFAAGLILLAVSAAAQTVSPVIVEYREKASGSFQVYNDSFVPLAVILEPRSFSVDVQGRPTFRPLDPEIRVDLSETSFRVGPPAIIGVAGEFDACGRQKHRVSKLSLADVGRSRS